MPQASLTIFIARPFVLLSSGKHTGKNEYGISRATGSRHERGEKKSIRNRRLSRAEGETMETKELNENNRRTNYSRLIRIGLP